MNEERIRQALEAATDTDQFLIGCGVLDRTPEVFEETFGRSAVLLVADENTWLAAGERVERAFREKGFTLEEPLVFPGQPTLPPEYGHIETVRERLAATQAIAVAVGSGTLNDIVKRASTEVGRRYMNVTTAASVDGFTAFGAAIIKDEFKQTLACAAPAAIVADVDVLRAAPAAMTAAGYADLMSEVTAGADWIIADMLGVEAIHDVSWDLVQTDLRSWIARPEALRDGDTVALEDLFEGLSMNGFAMQAMKNSRPASGTEHLFSHIWEMEHLEAAGGPVSHGFKVAMGTLAATALMETLFSRDIDALNVDDRCAGWITLAEREAEATAVFDGTPILQDVLQACRTKYVEASALAERLSRLKEVWPELKSRLERQLLPYAELVRMLDAAGVPTRPSAVGLTRERIRDTFPRANMIRTRFTALDLAYEVGWLEDCLDAIFSGDRYLVD